MSGHSKWNNIKHKKAALDAKKGKVFAILSKSITIATRTGSNPDPDQNPRLRLVLEKARSANMPKENIQRAIEKGLGKLGGNQIEEIVYEGFGPGGVGMMVKTLTDNRNRTASEIKTLFEKSGGSMGGQGCAGYLFNKSEDNYSVKIPISISNENRAKLALLVERLEDQEDVEVVFTNSV